MKSQFKDKISIGVDIEDINRFKKLSLKSDKSFLKKIFSDAELKYCFSRKNFASHLAVRFSAKESVIKALGAKQGEVGIGELEIVHNRNGGPMVLSDNLLFKKYTVKISMSHSKNLAISAALALKK